MDTRADTARRAAADVAAERRRRVLSRGSDPFAVGAGRAPDRPGPAAMAQEPPSAAMTQVPPLAAMTQEPPPAAMAKEPPRAREDVATPGRAGRLVTAAGVGLATAIPRRPRSADMALVRAGAVGFIAGAVFWHFVGFWDIVSQILFARPETVAALNAPPPPVAVALGPGVALETGSLRRLDKLTAGKSEPNCIAVARDLATGALSHVPCRRSSRLKPSDGTPAVRVARDEAVSKRAGPPSPAGASGSGSGWVTTAEIAEPPAEPADAGPGPASRGAVAPAAPGGGSSAGSRFGLEPDLMAPLALPAR